LSLILYTDIFLDFIAADITNLAIRDIIIYCVKYVILQRIIAITYETPQKAPKQNDYYNEYVITFLIFYLLFFSQFCISCVSTSNI